MQSSNMQWLKNHSSQLLRQQILKLVPGRAVRSSNSSSAQRYSSEHHKPMASREAASQLVRALLEDPHVKIDNVQTTTEKLASIIGDGDSNLHFISDFDNTMSQHWIRNDNNELIHNTTSHGIPARYSKISPQLEKKINDTFNKYYPIEIDRNMTREEKTPYMITWWTESNKNLVEENLTVQDIKEMTKEVVVEMRKGLSVVLNTCKERSIPFLVFSAGIGDLIEQSLRQANLFHSNMHVVSNMMSFNDKGVCVGFQEPLIHVFNKSEFQLEATDYFQSIKHRTNVILAGDSLGDLQMSQGIAHHVCLNIGFLNHDIKELEPRYLKAYDIVIEDDHSWDPVTKLLTSVNRTQCQQK